MLAIGRILCPVDFSDASAYAVEQAVAVARWSGASLTALHVEEPLFIEVPAFGEGVDRVSEERLGLAVERTTAFFDGAVAAGVPTSVCVHVGLPVPTILERAAMLPADLIVMGTHGLSGFKHLMLGSVTEKVLRSATCPVLTVPPRAQATSALPVRRILCAVDFSDWSRGALALAGAFVADAGATLDVVHVIEWPWKEPPQPDLGALTAAQAGALLELRRYFEASAGKRLQTWIAAAVPGDCTAEVHVCHGKPYVEILRLADERRADLIVMGVHARGLLDMALFGSTTNHVVRQAACPVLTVR